MTEFLNLDDDCLAHLFRFLDLKALCAIAGTCKRLDEITEGIFRRHHKNFVCSIRRTQDAIEAYKIIRKVGPHLIGLRLSFILPTAESSIGCQLLTKLNCLLGDNFGELYLHDPLWSIPISKLAPTFFKIQKLTIHVKKEWGCSENNHVDLPECPTLRSLRTEDFELTPNSAKSFQNLEELQIRHDERRCKIKDILPLLQNNRQLKILYIHINHLENDFDFIVLAKYLKDLKDLRMRTRTFASYHNLSAGVADLKRLHHLTTLVIVEPWDDVNHANSVLANLQLLKQLKTLWIGNIFAWPSWNRINQQLVVDFAKKLNLLESFVCYGMNCELGTIIGIVQFGRKLKRLGLALDYEGVVPVSFIENLANVRKLKGGEESPLLINLDDRFCTLIEDGLRVFQKPHIGRYLKWDHSSSLDLIYRDETWGESF